MNSTLSGHTDHSEFDLTSPLISIRYASIRICIFSPVQQHLFAAKPMEGFIEYVHRIPSRIKIGGGGGGGFSITVHICHGRYARTFDVCTYCMYTRGFLLR